MNLHHIAKKFLAKLPVIHHFWLSSKRYIPFTFTNQLKKHNITEHNREKMCNFVPNKQQFI